MPLRLKRNCTSHELGEALPPVSGGVNSHSFAAINAFPAKNLLGPADFRCASVTFPAASALTLTVILMVPEIVPRAPREISGSTWWRTEPGIVDSSEEIFADSCFADSGRVAEERGVSAC